MKPKDELTRREHDIYDYIVSFKTINGFAPTITEISIGLYTSRSFVREVLYRLQDLGYIRYDDSKRRSIVVVRVPLQCDEKQIS